MAGPPRKRNRNADKPSVSEVLDRITARQDAMGVQQHDEDVIAEAQQAVAETRSQHHARGDTPPS